jgi:hypothetical protein
MAPDKAGSMNRTPTTHLESSREGGSTIIVEKKWFLMEKGKVE